VQQAVGEVFGREFQQVVGSGAQVVDIDVAGDVFGAVIALRVLLEDQSLAPFLIQMQHDGTDLFHFSRLKITMCQDGRAMPSTITIFSR